MPKQLRVFPTLLTVLMLMLAVKVTGLWTGYQAISTAQAASSSGEHAKPDAHAKADAHDDGHASDSKEKHGKGDRHDDHAKPAPKKASDRITRKPIPGELGTVSAAELEVLEKLSERRSALAKRETELDLREKLLAATEQRIDDKVSELHETEERIKKILGMLDDREDQQMKSLVKIYESMKPKDAAPILQALDRTILVQVVSRMKETKMAAIMAQMEPKIAREVTVLLATRKEIPRPEGIGGG